MATTINSTGLDFNAIRNNLKTWIEQKPEFADYNFEASGLSNLLDVLAYNTHYNALTANFALNESFLSTAQLRSSVIGLSTAIGYIPNSKVSSTATINVTAPATASSASALDLPVGTQFTTTVDDIAYTFETTQEYTTFKRGTDPYSYTWENVVIREGTEKQKTFIAGPYSETDTYIIPNQDMDISTVGVTVGATNKAFTNVSEVSTINENSRIFTIKETPNGFFELAFGNGANLGETPLSGDKIVVTYNSTAGASANGAKTFTTTVSIPDGSGSTISITPITISNSSGGAGKESIESIRKSAPFLYASQNRMVTATDYSALIRKNFRSQITDILSWGGEDNIPAKYGSVYLSITPSPSEALKTSIRDLVRNLSVVSFDIEFIEPVVTFIEVAATFQFNRTLSSFSTIAQVEDSVKNTITSYLDTVTDEFSETFRKSNMLTLVDASDPGILSSQATIKMQRRFTPVLNLEKSYTITFPAGIETPTATNYTLQSTTFNYPPGLTCFLRNKLGSNVIQIVSVTNGKIINDNIGSYDPGTGSILLTSFNPSNVPDDGAIRISVNPANQGFVSTIRENKLGKDTVAITVDAIETTTL